MKTNMSLQCADVDGWMIMNYNYKKSVLKS